MPSSSLLSGCFQPHFPHDEGHVCGSGPQGLIQYCMYKPWALMYLFSVLFCGGGGGGVWRQWGSRPSFAKTSLLSNCAQFVSSPALVLCRRMFCFFVPTCSSSNCPFSVRHSGHHSATPTLSAVSSAFTFTSLFSLPRPFPATAFSLVSSPSVHPPQHLLYWLVTGYSHLPRTCPAQVCMLPSFLYCRLPSIRIILALSIATAKKYFLNDKKEHGL